VKTFFLAYHVDYLLINSYRGVAGNSRQNCSGGTKQVQYHGIIGFLNVAVIFYCSDYYCCFVPV